jgi:hypothetical protein
MIAAKWNKAIAQTVSQLEHSKQITLIASSAVPPFTPC